MNYAEAGAWLYGAQMRGIKLGLENTVALLALLGVETKGGSFIHVAGTNGKGSVCALLDAICRAGGLRTGLFTSPHLVTFRERIQVNGRKIGEEEVAEGLTRIRGVIESNGMLPTFFEITTALALDYFQRERLDVTILETGLGGRFDATNVVTPVVSVLTSIDMDHQAWLGSTLAAIAGEKAGIIKPGVPVVSVPQREEAAEVLLQTAAEKGSPLAFIPSPVDEDLPGLPGSHQRWNAALAISALSAGSIAVSEEAIKSGLREVNWQGRFQVLGERYVLDGAHNPAAAERLVLTWKETYGDAKATVVLGVLKDKDVRAICAALLPVAARFVVTPVRSGRSASAGELEQAIRSTEPWIPCTTAASLPAALEVAQARTPRILVTGSLFLVGEALAFLDGSGAAPEFTLQ